VKDRAPEGDAPYGQSLALLASERVMDGATLSHYRDLRVPEFVLSPHLELARLMAKGQ
jgi:hypothetical protein